MAPRLKAAGIDLADGFSLNVSNYQATPDLLKYGHALSALLGGKHFIIDTSRNGNGAPQGVSGDDERAWCNPDGRALGTPPTTNTGDPLCDAFYWLKPPGRVRRPLQPRPGRRQLVARKGAGDGPQRQVVTNGDRRRRADGYPPYRSRSRSSPRSIDLLDDVDHQLLKLLRRQAQPLADRAQLRVLGEVDLAVRGVDRGAPAR